MTDQNKFMSQYMQQPVLPEPPAGWHDAQCKCPECKSGYPVYYRTKEDDEGHEDYQYKCQNPTCGHSWWVDGIDS